MRERERERNNNYVGQQTTFYAQCVITSHLPMVGINWHDI
jgi:hypothetical protein